MKEVLYVISGKRLPVVFHVGARALTSQALNIHAGHDDVMGVADTGWGILFARNAQEAADLTAIARRVAEETQTPFFVVPGRLPDDPHARERARCPRTSCCATSSATRASTSATCSTRPRPLMTGVVQNQDSYMKGRIGQRAFYDRLPGRAPATRWTSGRALTGRRYAPDRRLSLTEDAEDDPRRDGHHRRHGDRRRRPSRAPGPPRRARVAVTSLPAVPGRELVEALGIARAVAVVERTDEPPRPTTR